MLVCFSTCLESLCEVLVVIEIAFVTSHYKPNEQFKKDFKKNNIRRPRSTLQNACYDYPVYLFIYLYLLPQSQY